MQTAASKQNQKKNGFQLSRAYATAERAPTQVLGEKNAESHTHETTKMSALLHTHTKQKKHEKQAPYSGNTQKKNLLFSGRRSSKVWKKEDDVFKTPTPIHTYTQKYIVFLLFLSSFKKKKRPV